MGSLIRRGTFMLGLAAVAVACDTALGPGDGDQVRIVVRPTFEALAADEHEAGAADPALRVDNVRVQVASEADGVVVEQVVEWPLDQDTLRIELTVEVAGTESFTFELEGREGDDVLFRAGPLDVELSSDTGTQVEVTPVLEYAGAEASLTDVLIQGPESAFLAGSTVQLTATGTDGEGESVTEPRIVWSSLDTLAATVDSTGLVTVRHDAARTVRVVGRVAFRTLADTLALPVAPARLALAPDTGRIAALGFDAELSAAPVGEDGEPVRNAAIEWVSRSPATLFVVPGQETGPTGVVRAVAADSVWVVARSGPTADSVLVAIDQEVTAAAPIPTRAILQVGDTLAAQVAPLDAGGSPVAGAPVTWSWTGSAAVTVSAEGVARAEGPGAGQLLGDVEGESYGLEVDVYGGGSGLGPTAQLAVGDFHACLVEAVGGEVYCWGENQSGQLGIGQTSEREDRPTRSANAGRTGSETVARLAAGGLHSCTLLDDAGATRLFCWGDNRFGQLGDGSLTDRAAPVAVQGGLAFVDVTVGGLHTCGLDAAGAAYCWGLDLFGQLGDGSPGDVSLVPTAVAGGHTFTELDAGWLHTCGLATDGSTWCWGRGEEGELGNGDLVDSAVPVQVVGGHTFTALKAGAAHTCGLEGGALHCWGYNSSGQAGTGTQDVVIPEPTPVVFDGGVAVADFALGWIHGCALTTAGEVYCWGGNDALQLGQALPRAIRSGIPVPLGFSPDSLAGGGSRTCAVDGTRTICWGGLPREYLGRDQVTGVVPDPAAAAFSRR